MLRPKEAQGQIPGQRFIDPEVLTRIDNLELIARSVVDGFISGLHQSPMLGMSVDFAEHRSYMPGDDVRRIDWRVFARTDRLYVKEFEADTNANLHLLLDISKSMDFGSAALTKLDYAKFLAASLAYVSKRQRDRIGLITFDSKIVETIPPSIRHFNAVERVPRSVATNRREPAPAQPGGADFGSVRTGRAAVAGDRPAAPPRQRPDRVPPARPARA
jgi:uncharacterized protein (DUF58 family)